MNAKIDNYYTSVNAFKLKLLGKFNLTTGNKQSKDQDPHGD